jgi:hypothetical protein
MNLESYFHLYNLICERIKNMSFTFSDRHIDEYRTRGYTVFRRILPAALIDDLRRACNAARSIARENNGPQVQRLQPVENFDIDQQPFIDYAELAPLNDAIARLLTPAYRHGQRQFMGILLEPAERPYCTPWHRDWRDNMAGLDLARWDAIFADDRYFNQVNCALYDDPCTWVVPGSHLRRDLPGEVARFPQRPIAGPELDGLSYAEREYACLEYVRSMPGAAQLLLEAGDYCLYRNTLWHMGNYVPYRQRATLHDAADTDEYMAWRKVSMEELRVRREAGAEVEMENPNKGSKKPS